MKIIHEYVTDRGGVSIVAMDRSYGVIFYTTVKPGLSYHKEFLDLTYPQALAKYNGIAQIYKQDSISKCGFYNKSNIKTICCKSSCPLVLGNSKSWDIGSYDCIYRGR